MRALWLGTFILVGTLAGDGQPSPATFRFINLAGANEGLLDPIPRSSLPAHLIGDNPGATLGEIRRLLFEAAGQRWSRFLLSAVTIEVEVDFEDQGGLVDGGILLASAGPIAGVFGFVEGLDAETIYPYALANSIAGEDLDSFSPDIVVSINSNSVLEDPESTIKWYYGLDGEAPAGTVDLLGVIAHELGHGLGFVSFINLNDDPELDLAVGENANAPFNDVFTRKIYDQEQGKYWPEMTTEERAASARNNPHLVFDGPYTNAAVEGVNNFLNQGKARAGEQTQIRLHAPSDIEQGSSVSHWSEEASPNLLMEPNYDSNLGTDLDLSPLFMKDLGWPTKDIEIPHLTYALWRSEYELSPSSLPSLDDDLDGKSNLVEYFHGTDPTSAESSRSAFLSLSQKTLTYERSSLPNDLRVTYQRSSTLRPLAWDSFTPEEERRRLSPQTESIEVELLGDLPREFFRLDFSLVE